MSNQANQVEKISDAIKVLQGGIDFYQDAIKEIDTDHIVKVFHKMVREKREAIDALQPFAIDKRGEKETDSDWMVTTRKMYTRLIGKMSNDESHTYVKQLEEVEDRVLEVLDEALAKDQPELCLATLRRVRARAQQLHDEMKALQEATA